MSIVAFNVNNSTPLSVMVPQTNQQAAVPMPASGGLYVIYNENTNNRYVGTSKNLYARFTGRQQVISELGVSVDQMNQVWAFWGQVQTQDTNSQIANSWTDDGDYAAGSMILLDNQNINLETLLIRFFAGSGVLAGSTLTNYDSGVYNNPTPNDVVARVTWGLGNNQFYEATWPAGGGW